MPCPGVVALWYGISFGQASSFFGLFLLHDSLYAFEFLTAVWDESVEEGVSYPSGVEDAVGVVVSACLVPSEKEHHLGELISSGLTCEVFCEDAYAVDLCSVFAGAGSVECRYLVVYPYGR